MDWIQCYNNIPFRRRKSESRLLRYEHGCIIMFHIIIIPGMSKLVGTYGIIFSQSINFHLAR